MPCKLEPFELEAFNELVKQATDEFTLTVLLVSFVLGVMFGRQSCLTGRDF